MYRGFNVIPFIPAGRERTLRHLTTSLLRFQNRPVDQVYLWRNTKEQSDLNYIDGLKNDFFKVFPFPDDREFKMPKQLNTGMFYRYTQDPKTIYLRFDDDIVYIDDQYFKNILDFRIDHPEYFVVFGNIWNNAITSYIHQRLGHISPEKGVVESEFCMDEVGWRKPEFAVHIHRILLDKIAQGKTSDLFFDRWELHNAKRFSVSNFAFFGGTIPEIDGEEESWITEYYTKANNKLNVICGSALCAHFTFMFQRQHILLTTNYLQDYLKIAQDKLSANYYSFVEA